MQTLFQDIGYGWRMLRKFPGISAVAIIAIALGIAANTIIFSAVDATLLRPFNFANQRRLVMIWERNQSLSVSRSEVAPGNYNDWQAQNQSFEKLVAMEQRWFDLSENQQPERYAGYAVTTELFQALSVQAALGRVLLPEDAQPGREQVVTLRYGFWQQRFNGDPTVIGRTVTINQKPFMVVGVMPPGFEFPYHRGDLWMPLVFTPEILNQRKHHWLEVVGLLKPGVTIEQAQADLRAIAARSAASFPDTNRNWDMTVMSVSAYFTRGVRAAIPIMIAAMFFVLLIACANVANLLLARGAAREKEFAVRLAIGAGRWRLMRQLLTESVLIALIGGALGLLLSLWGIDGMAKGIPATFSRFIPGWSQLGLNWSVFGYTLLVSTLTGIVTGLFPAWQATRLNLNESLKDASKGSAYGGSRSRLRRALVISEVALSLALLTCAGLMIRSFINLVNADLGIRPNNVLSMNLALNPEKYKEGAPGVEAFRALTERLATVPGVVAAGAVNNLPMGGTSNYNSFEVVGWPASPDGQKPTVDIRIATPNYFAAIGTALRRGRLITAQDAASFDATEQSTRRVVLVNEAFVRSYLPEGEAMGRFLKIGDRDEPVEIVGIVADVKNEDLDERNEPSIYLPHAQMGRGAMDLVIRVNGDPHQMIAAVRNEIRAFDTSLSVYNIRTVQSVIEERRSPKRLLTAMLGVFAGIALLLAAVGLYAMMSYTVAQRYHEIGIRLALGAEARDILQLVAGQGLRLTLIGLALGLGLAVVLTQAMTPFLFGVSATDPVTFIGIGLLLLLIALLACLVPAQRATKVDPMIALRCE
jgi:putative ABC transport system permease protein